MNTLVIVTSLVLLEGLLSFDNALVLATLVKHLDGAAKKKALTYGILGAFAFRSLSLFGLTTIIATPWVRAFGAGWLIVLALRHFLGGDKEKGMRRTLPPISLWRTILVIEVTDAMFSVDSIMASVGVSQKLWVILLGGVLGIVMMRYASILFIKLIDLFPNFEGTGFLLVLLIGIKLFASIWVDVEAGTPYLMFWGVFILSLASGFLPVKEIEVC